VIATEASVPTTLLRESIAGKVDEERRLDAMS